MALRDVYDPSQYPNDGWPNAIGLINGLGRGDIIAFRGNRRFLSNFAPAEVKYDRTLYPTVEHAYQAAKTIDVSARMRIYAASKAGLAKAYGQGVVLREGWNGMRCEVMEELLRQKFSQSKFKSLLNATGDVLLIEGNTWGDRFWGMTTDINREALVGENHLGRLLMKVRKELT